MDIAHSMRGARRTAHDRGGRSPQHVQLVQRLEYIGDTEIRQIHDMLRIGRQQSHVHRVALLGDEAHEAQCTELLNHAIRTAHPKAQASRWTASEISPQRLLPLDGFEQRLEVAFAEAAGAFALNDLVEHGRAILHRLGEDLQQIALVITIHEDA